MTENDLILFSSERFIKEFILYYDDQLSKKGIKNRYEQRWLGGNKYYDGYKNDITRPLIITPIYGCYNCLSSVVFQIEGSPPRGTLIVFISDYSSTVIKAVFISMRKTRSWELYDDENPKNLRINIEELIKEKKIPKYLDRNLP